MVSGHIAADESLGSAQGPGLARTRIGAPAGEGVQGGSVRFWDWGLF